MPVILDARILAYNDTGIARYVRHLYRAMREVVDVASAGGGAPPVAVTVLESRRDTRHHLSTAWPDSRVAWTPPHHRAERWALAAEVGLAAASVAAGGPGLGAGRPVVHSPDHVAPGRFAPLGGRRWRSVVTIHDLAFRKVPETHAAASRAYYSGIDHAVREAEAIICPSQATATDLLEMTGGDPARVWVVPEAADPRYQPPSPGREEVRAARPYILTVGTIESRKNIKTLVEAVALLPAERRPLVKIVGSRGGAYPELARLVASRHLDRDVAFMGRIGTEEIASLYRNAAAAAYLSLYEGFGLPVLEAMASGCPVVASRASSIPEVAGDAAILVDPIDPVAVAAALDRLMGDAALATDLRRRGLARAASFSWTAAALRTIDVFRVAAA